MKFFFCFFFFNFFLTFGQKLDRSQLIIPPKQVVQIHYPLYKRCSVKIWNKSKFNLVVSARNRKTDSIYKGFRLEKGSSASLILNQGIYLQFQNPNFTALKVEYTLQNGTGSKLSSIKPLQLQRAFYLENNTAQNIPLKIPGVMNPTLRPFSRSGVDLANGQKIFIDLNGKQILILTVSDTIKHGARLDLENLINKAINSEYK